MVVLKDVSVIFPNHAVALSEVSLTIDKGEFVFLVGPTGAGKSTLLKLLYRDARPRSGEVWVNGQEVGRLKARRVPYLRREMGIVPQDFGLLPNKRVSENIAYALRVIGINRFEVRRRLPEILDRVGLERKANAFPHELSGGEQQRVAIARAIANNPMIVLADEPTGNLDPDTSWEIMQLLSEINSRGATVIVATHDALMVDRMKKRVIKLDLGTVMRDTAESTYVHSIG